MQVPLSARGASFALDALAQAAPWSWGPPWSGVALLWRHGGLFGAECTDHSASK